MKQLKSILTTFLGAICMTISMIAQTGKVFDKLTMDSEILKIERKFAIYLPPDYETSQRSYPVHYLLHGGGDDQSGWIQFGEVLHIADKAIKEGSATAKRYVKGRRWKNASERELEACPKCSPLPPCPSTSTNPCGRDPG